MTLKRLRSTGMALLCVTAQAALAGMAYAVGRPAPGTDAALPGKTINYGMSIGVVVAIVVAIASGIWWYLSRASKSKDGR